MGADAARAEQLVRDLEERELGLPLGMLGMVRGVRARRRHVRIDLALPIAEWPGRRELVERVRRAVEALPDVDEASVEVELMGDSERGALRAALRRAMAGPERAEGEESAQAEAHAAPEVPRPAQGQTHAQGHGQGSGPLPAFLQPGSSTRVVGIASGKGGVGKSSVAVNLALALARAGHDVGLLDADVYGFSIPGMLGGGRDPLVLGDMVVPARVHGVRCLSMGFFVPDDQPVIWRGPMLHKAVEQFLSDAYWGRPDFLLVDMPPGTGDVTLSLSQVMPRTEVVVVTTPQPAAQRVAQRSAFAARKLKLSVRGVVENMSWFTGHDGTRYELFGQGGGRQLADDLGVPLLGQIPLVPAIREGGDHGIPVVVADPASDAAAAFGRVAEQLVALGPARVYRRELSIR